METNKTSGIRVLHTSDWHLGRTLHDRARDDEFDAFLAWMLDTVNQLNIDVLVIAGDVFDTSNPSYATQKKYYDFCVGLSRTCCRHAVITSGNHDSTTFIDVPAPLLSSLNIHVVGRPRFGIGNQGDPGDEVIVLKDKDGNDEMIVAAVPFLSDGDVRYSEAGEDTATKEQKVMNGVSSHYRMVAQKAEEIRAGREIPVIGMGHLYVSQGIIGEDTGVRQTYVGSLGGVSSSMFGPEFDYVALGHLHVPQTVAGKENIRYSGSPLAMGFGEAGQQKSVCVIQFEGKKPDISLYNVPCFHRMERVTGDMAEIESRLKELVLENTEIYISVTYTGTEYINDLRASIQDILGDNENVKCLDTKNNCRMDTSWNGSPRISSCITLNDVEEHAVFHQLLESATGKFSEDRRKVLEDTFEELLRLVQAEM